MHSRHNRIISSKTLTTNLHQTEMNRVVKWHREHTYASDSRLSFVPRTHPQNAAHTQHACMFVCVLPCALYFTTDANALAVDTPAFRTVLARIMWNPAATNVFICHRRRRRRQPRRRGKCIASSSANIHAALACLW